MWKKLKFKLTLLQLYFRCKKGFFFEKLFSYKKKRILFVAMTHSIHAARWISQLTSSSNLEIHIFHSMTEGTPHLLIKNNRKITIHHYDDNSKNYFLEKVIDYFQPDIIHTLEMQHAAYKLLSIKQKRSKNFPLWFCSCWGSDIKWFEQFPEHKEKITQVLKECDAFFCEDKQTIEKVIKSYGFKKPILKVLCAGGFHVNYYRNKFKFIPPSKRKYLVVKGYSGWVYKPETVFEAIKICHKEIINNGLKIIVYLPGTIHNYVKELQSLGLEVKLFKKTGNYDKVMKLFSRAKVNIAASLSDGIPTSMLEGMLMGAFPIQSISAISDSATECIINGKNGFLLNPTDVSGYAKLIENAITNNKLLDDAANFNFKLIKNKFDYDIIRKKVLKFYENFLQNQSKMLN